MPQTALAKDAAQNQIEIHLLDVGARPYGDCELCLFGGLSVLIDGGHKGDEEPGDRHRSIPQQLAGILSQPPDKLHVDLLIVTHTHADHFGCLPALVGQDKLTADWCLLADTDLGWGVTADTRDLVADAAIDPRVRWLMEAFRDDSDPESPVPPISDFLPDAVLDRQRYQAFVDKLRAGGNVALYDKGPAPGGGGELDKLIKHFGAQGLEIDILGPSGTQLVECAKGLAATLQEVRDFAEAKLAVLDSTDAILPIASLFSDAARNPSRGGNFVNLQSMTTVFRYAGRKFLFTGDLQSEDPSTPWNHIPITAALRKEIGALRQAIFQEAPYDFVKLGHHGSHNAFSADFLDSLKDTVLFGISLGARSPCHPDDKQVLPLLRERRKSIQWLRTDLNGLTSLTFNRSGVFFEKAAGRVNDDRPNPAGCPKPGGGRGSDAASAIGPAPAVEVVSQGAVVAAHSDMIQVSTRVPYGDREIRIDITIPPVEASRRPVDPPASTHPDSGTPDETPPAALRNKTITPLQVAGGAELPKLLFVTSREQLRKNVGNEECDAALAAVSKCGGVLLDDLRAGMTSSHFDESIERVRQAVSKDAGIKGVVLIGGYDVVPTQIVDTLPEDLQRSVPANYDFDDWMIWCDDEYGVKEEDGSPAYWSLPVSRVPDARYAPLLFAGLQSKYQAGLTFGGIRNNRRPFAARVRPEFQDGKPLLISGPTRYDMKYDLSASCIYLMLHGHLETPGEFCGEDEPFDYVSALRLENVPKNCSGSVVLCGCCWGALISSVPAAQARRGESVGSRAHDRSIPLQFLLNGASAFVGATGAHFSSTQRPNVAGGAMHRAFLTHLLDNGLAPAEALMRAKADFADAMPHGTEASTDHAAENKTLFEFTCLGLGW